MGPLLLLLSSALLHLEPPVGLEPADQQRLGAAAEQALRRVERSVIVLPDPCDAPCALDAAKQTAERRIVRLGGIGGPTRVRVLITEIDPRSGAALASTSIDLPRSDPSAWPELLAPGMALRTAPEDPSEDHTATVLQLGLLGVGAVAIVGGSILGQRSLAARDDLLGATSSEAARDQGDRAATQGTWATVLIGAGVGAVAAGVAWLVGGDP